LELTDSCYALTLLLVFAIPEFYLVSFSQTVRVLYLWWIIFTRVTSLPFQPVNSSLFYNKSTEINLDFQNSNYCANL